SARLMGRAPRAASNSAACCFELRLRTAARRSAGCRPSSHSPSARKSGAPFEKKSFRVMPSTLPHTDNLVRSEFMLIRLTASLALHTVRADFSLGAHHAAAARASHLPGDSLRRAGGAQPGLQAEAARPR